MTDLRAAVRAVYVELLRDRERYANSNGPGDIVRAVAYQSAAARIMRALDDNPEPTARYLEAPHERLCDVPRENLGGLYTEDR